MIGTPALVPKYALGYLASSMGYAESENAQQLLESFPKLCRKWDIPCDLIHLSSGYTVDPVTGARNVFTWNYSRQEMDKAVSSSLNSYFDQGSPIPKSYSQVCGQRVSRWWQMSSLGCWKVIRILPGFRVKRDSSGRRDSTSLSLSLYHTSLFLGMIHQTPLD